MKRFILGLGLGQAAGLVIGLLASGRFQLVVSPASAHNLPAVYRLDRLTGEVDVSTDYSLTWLRVD